MEINLKNLNNKIKRNWITQLQFSSLNKMWKLIINSKRIVLYINEKTSLIFFIKYELQ